jgi:hypothetical protein
MPTVGFGDLRSQLESPEFAAIVGIASTPRGFITMLRRQPAFQSLVDCLTEDFELRSAVVSRIDALASQEVDTRYLNPWDTALASYLYALSIGHGPSAMLVADAVERARNTMWAQNTSRSLLNRRRHEADYIAVDRRIRKPVVDEETRGKDAVFRAPLRRVKGLAGEITYYGSSPAGTSFSGSTGHQVSGTANILVVP